MQPQCTVESIADYYYFILVYFVLFTILLYGIFSLFKLILFKGPLQHLNCVGHLPMMEMGQHTS